MAIETAEQHRNRQCHAPTQGHVGERVCSQYTLELRYKHMQVHMLAD